MSNVQQRREAYLQFLRDKMPRAERAGFEPPSEPVEGLFPHQVDICRWACRGGRRAVFANFGLGKTRMHLQIAKWVHEETGGRYLIVAPLGVRQEFTKVDAPAMGMTLDYVRTDEEAEASTSPYLITNYERVRDGNITLSQFKGAGLDEASVLRSFGSKTYQTFLDLFEGLPFRYVFTATPSPNRHKELIHYAGFLGVMDTGEALTRFFQRNSEQANDLTLYPHMEQQFWYWLSTWAVFLQKPSELGYSDKGYDLPPMDVQWHKVDVDHRKAWSQHDSWGQAQLFQDQSTGLKEGAEIKRETIEARLECAMEIMAGAGEETHWLLWHDLEREREAIQKAMPDAVCVWGNQDLDTREERILGFARGEFRVLATKPVIAGSGCNFQRHCSHAIFMGVGYKFNDFIQAVHRIYRFQQSKVVTIHIIYSESESNVMETLKHKWRQHDELMGKMSDLLKEHKLTNLES
jgi:hypothetical protein